MDAMEGVVRDQALERVRAASDRGRGAARIMGERLSGDVARLVSLEGLMPSDARLVELDLKVFLCAWLMAECGEMLEERGVELERAVEVAERAADWSAGSLVRAFQAKRREADEGGDDV